jgi:hypothetical protein
MNVNWIELYFITSILQNSASSVKPNAMAESILQIQNSFCFSQSITTMIS